MILFFRFNNFQLRILIFNLNNEIDTESNDSEKDFRV